MSGAQEYSEERLILDETNKPTCVAEGYFNANEAAILGIGELTISFLQTAVLSGTFSRLSVRQRNVLEMYYGSDLTIYDQPTLGQEETLTAFIYSAMHLLHSSLPAMDQETFLMGHKLILKKGDLEFQASLDRSARMRRIWQRKAYRSSMSKKIKEKWKDPSYREQLQTKRSQQWDDAAKAAQSTKMQLVWQDPAYRENLSQQRRQQMLEKWQNPLYRERMEQLRRDSSPRIMSEQGRQNISNGLKGKPKSEAHKARISQALRERAEKRRNSQQL